MSRNQKDVLDEENPADQGAAANADQETPAAPSYLLWIGRPDVYISGVPQANLQVIAEPSQAWQVTPERAIQLLKSGLFQASVKELEVGSPIAAAEGEVKTNG